MAEEQEVTLLPATQEKIDAWLLKFPKDKRRSGILFALRVAQEQHGWLPKSLMQDVARHLGVPPIEVYEVANFYSMYNLKPVGKRTVGICHSISCALRGSNDLREHCKKRLNADFGETSSDNKVTVQEVECLGACVGAPVAIIDGKHYHEHLSVEKFDALLDRVLSDEECAS